MGSRKYHMTKQILVLSEKLQILRELESGSELYNTGSISSLKLLELQQCDPFHWCIIFTLQNRHPFHLTTIDLILFLFG